MHAIGRHIILEMWRCSGLSLNSLETAEQALREMVAALDVHLLDLKVYPFSPVGVTGIAIVSESHLVIHTWPEHVQVMEINRGQLDLPEGPPPEAQVPVKTSKSPRAHGRSRAPALSA